MPGKRDETKIEMALDQSEQGRPARVILIINLCNLKVLKVTRSDCTIYGSLGSVSSFLDGITRDERTSKLSWDGKVILN